MAFFMTFECMIIAGLFIWIGLLVLPLVPALGLVLGSLGGFGLALGVTLRCRRGF